MPDRQLDKRARQNAIASEERCVLNQVPCEPGIAAGAMSPKQPIRLPEKKEAGSLSSLPLQTTGDKKQSYAMSLDGLGFAFQDSLGMGGDE